MLEIVIRTVQPCAFIGMNLDVKAYRVMQKEAIRDKSESSVFIQFLGMCNEYLLIKTLIYALKKKKKEKFRELRSERIWPE